MARFRGGPEELCSGQNGHSEHSGSADLVKILLRITHRKCIVSGFERLVYQNICLILYLFQTSTFTMF